MGREMIVHHMGWEMIVRHMGWEMIVRHFRNEKATGAEMGIPIDSGIVTGDMLDSYWPIFSLSLVTVPEVFAKVNSVQFPWRLLSGEYVIFIHFNLAWKWVSVIPNDTVGTVLGRPILTQFTAQLRENQKKS